MTDNENKQRRIDDRLPDAQIDWNKPGAPAVAHAAVGAAEPIGYARESELAKLADNRIAGVGMMIHKEPGEGMVALHLASSIPAAPSQAVAEVRAQAQLTLPNGWKIDRGGDDLRLRAKDGMWCGFTPTHESPAHRLTLEFLGDLLAAIESGAPATAGQSDAERDAARYRWLKSRFAGYDFYWMGKPPYEAAEDQGKCVIVFECGQDFDAGRDFEKAIDRATVQIQQSIQSEKGEQA